MTMSMERGMVDGGLAMEEEDEEALPLSSLSFFSKPIILLL